MAESIDKMYSHFQNGEEKYIRIIPVTLTVFTTSGDHARGIRDGMDHTIRMLSQYFDVVMRMKPYVEQYDEDKWAARTRFALAPTAMPPGIKPRWIEIQSGSFEEKVLDF